MLAVRSARPGGAGCRAQLMPRSQPSGSDAAIGEVHARSAAGAHDQLLDRALGDQAPAIDETDAVADALGLLHVVRAVDDRRACRARAPHLGEKLLARLEIDADGGLVEQQYARSMHQAAGEIQAALHASRRATARVVGALEQAHLGEHQGACDARLAAREPLHAGEVPDVLERAQASGRAPDSAARARSRRGAIEQCPDARPSITTRPESGRRMVASIDSIVVLPAPLGPSSPTTSPAARSG